MTRVRIAPPDTEEDVSAEQVADWLLARGWVQYAATPYWRTFTLGLCTVNVPGNYNERNERRLAESIHDIARAEHRHPSAVLADIVGPARAASVGVVCADRPTGAPWVAQMKCLVAGWPEEKRKSAMRNFLAFVSELDDEEDDSAARRAGESEE